MELQFSLLIGIIFGAIAALMAFLITYNEYEKHKLPPRRLWKEALGSAGLAFIVFLVLAVAASYWAFHLGG